jgi:hypothetical protein
MEYKEKQFEVSDKKRAAGRLEKSRMNSKHH